MAMTAPSLERISDAVKEAETEEAFWQRHYAELVKEHPEEFVAVSDGSVVAHSPNLQQLFQLVETKGVEPTQVWVRFITSEPHNMML